LLYREAFSRTARAAGRQATGYGLRARNGNWRAVRAFGSSLQPPASSLAAALALLACGSASAANWEIAPRVEAGYRYNDNYRLELPGGEIEVSGAEADAGVTFRTIDPRTRFEITPRVRATYFPDESDQDSTDYFFATLFEDTTPRRRIGVLADFAREDVVRSELPTTEIGGDLGDPDDVDSGRILLERNRRDLIRVLPYYSYDVSQRFIMDIEGRYVDASYDKTFENEQQDFSEKGITVGAGIRMTPRSTLSLRGVASQYETSFDTDAYGAHLEWGADLSPNSRFYLRAGAQQTEPDDRESDTNVIAGIGGRWQSERNRLFLDLTRSVGPVSAGTIVERHQLRFRLDHDISQRLISVLGARFSRDEAIDEASTLPRREYAAAEAGLEWRIQRQFALTATYTYRWQEYADEPSDASANGFLLGFIYEPKRAD
jgi:hypothetical protein